MNKEIRMILPKKELIQVEYIGESINYYEDIYNIYTSLQHTSTISESGWNLSV